MRCTRTLIATLSLVSVVALSVAGSPDRGVRSVTPGKRWEDAFVTGNGRMGALLFGSPTNQTFVANHCRLFLPLGNREIVPDLAQHVPELRKTIREQGYGDAMKLLLGKAKEQGYPGLTWTDKFHPGVSINLRQPAAGAIRDYERTEDFATGEVSDRWRDDHGEFRRRMFVSRTDNVIALQVSGPVPCELVFPAIEHEPVESQQETGSEWVSSRNTHRKGKGGFETAVRIVRNNRFEDCNRGAAFREAALCAIAYLKEYAYPAKPGVHRDVTLEGNRIVSTDESGIFAVGVDGLTLRNNIIEQSGLLGTRPHGKEPSWIQDCARVIRE